MLIDTSISMDPRAAVAGAEAAEATGYDGIWTAETSHDPFIPLALAAPVTTSAILGTGIAVAFARNPMLLANTGYDLQLLSEGRFVLGLGSQIKPHITKRFSMEWSKPAARMREMVLAIRAIWDCWDEGTRLDFRGDFYNHTLMTPFFNPGPNPFGQAKITIAAVGPLMTQVAGEVCDGLIAHPFTTPEFVRDVTIPAISAGQAKSGRSGEDFELKVPAFIVTGSNEQEMETVRQAVCGQISFYGSTPAYKTVLDHHGLGDLQPELNRLSKAGEWAKMATMIDDEILNTFAVVAEPDQVAAKLSARFGDTAQRLSFNTMTKMSDGFWEPIIADLKAA
jgi:probable F420-dependent oxidoreductase